MPARSPACRRRREWLVADVAALRRGDWNAGSMLGERTRSRRSFMAQDRCGIQSQRATCG